MEELQAHGALHVNAMLLRIEPLLGVNIDEAAALPSECFPWEVFQQACWWLATRACKRSLRRANLDGG